MINTTSSSLARPFLLVGLATVSLLIVVQSVRKLFVGKSTPSNKVKKLIIYPIKSVQGVEVDHLQVLYTGVKYGIIHDRSFMLINENNNMITQRTKPKLSLIKTKLNGDQIILNAPGMSTLEIHYELDTSQCERVKFKLFDQETEGFDCGEEYNRWFSEFLKSPAKLVKFTANMPYRGTNVVKDDQVMIDPQHRIIYQDGAPVLLINQASIKDLNSKLDSSTQLDYRSFRPNILVQSGKAFEEDDWIDFSIGQVPFTNVKLCTRCTLTTVKPDQGVKHPGQEPLKTLKTYRLKQQHLYKDSPLFGTNLIVNQEGNLFVGDKVVLPNDQLKNNS